MIRILVVDESTAVRETLALILGREFEVVQRQDLSDESLSLHAEQIDLLILGCPSGLGARSLSISRVVSQVPCPVLFLLDSRPSAGFGGGQERVDWLTKPFNPYELKEKIACLLDRSGEGIEPTPHAQVVKDPFARYLDFPYLPKPVSELARKFAILPISLLIIGEDGCGQENVARAIHASTPQAGPWIPVYIPELGEDFDLERFAASIAMEKGAGERITFFLYGLEGLGFSGQASLLRCFQREEKAGKEVWILSSSRVDLLEKVYQGKFLEPLYYRLATLTLRIPPLRDRLSDLPSLTAQMARECAQRMDLGAVRFSPDALERLRHYLWFGNIKELEALITRTLAIHRKGLIEAPDLVWDTGERDADQAYKEGDIAKREGPSYNRALGNGYLFDLKVLINELAHELKNPMVTIKTFAQLLGERFDDQAFRTQFQERVGSDIERIDDVLETLVEFSRFNEPKIEKVSLLGQLQRVFEELVPKCVERDASIRWGNREEEIKVFVDQRQFRYTLINILRTVLSQVKAKGEIKVEIGQDGKVSMSYVREGSGTSSLDSYLDSASQSQEDEALPLRVLLAKNLLERVGGHLEVNHLGNGGRQIMVVVPTASP